MRIDDRDRRCLAARLDGVADGVERRERRAMIDDGVPFASDLQRFRWIRRPSSCGRQVRLQPADQDVDQVLAVGRLEPMRAQRPGELGLGERRGSRRGSGCRRSRAGRRATRATGNRRVSASRLSRSDSRCSRERVERAHLRRRAAHPRDAVVTSRNLVPVGDRPMAQVDLRDRARRRRRGSSAPASTRARPRRCRGRRAPPAFATLPACAGASCRRAQLAVELAVLRCACRRGRRRSRRRVGARCARRSSR